MAKVNTIWDVIESNPYSFVMRLSWIILILAFILSAPAEDAKIPVNSPAVVQASPAVEPYDNQDEKQVNAGEEANNAMEKTETELANKVRMIKSLN